MSDNSNGAVGEAREVAGEHFRRGVKFYNDGEYKLALVEFRRSFEISKNPRVLYNIGQVNQQLNNYAKAVLALEEYLRQLDAELTSDRRAAVAHDLEELRSKTALLRVKVDIDGAEVFIDDALVGRSPLSAPVLVDAGDHRIEVRREGYELMVEATTLTGKDHGDVSIQMKRRNPSVVMARNIPSASSGPRAVRPAVWVGWIATGALAVGAGVTGAVAASHAGELASLRQSSTATPAELDSERNRARNFALVADGLALGAVASGAVALYMTLRRGEAPERIQRSRSTPQVQVGLTGVWVTQRF